MKYLSTILFISLLCTGCIKTEPEGIPEHLSEIENLTVFSSDAPAGNDIKFMWSQVFEESEELPIARISGIAVDESERVYISESVQGRASIHVFDAGGSYLTSLGGYGEGPGEFRSIVSPQIVDGKLYARDGRQLKINVYSLDSLSFERSIQLGNWSHREELDGIFPVDITVLDENKIVVSFLKFNDHTDRLYYFMMDRTGEIISDMILGQLSAEHFARPANGGSFLSPYSGRGLMFVSGQEHLYTVWTEDILVKKYTIDGAYQSAFYHPFMHKELSRDEVLNYIDTEEYRAAVRNTGIPQRWPALHSVVMDDGNNFWISTIIDDEDAYEWWILSSSGDIISKFEWPKSKEIRIVQNGSAYVLETEEDTGLQRVVRYRYEFE